MASHDNNKIILYADYSERNITAARQAVKPLGFDRFVPCDDRERTVELVAELKPDIVLIGLYLDGMRGISTISAIRDAASDTTPHGRNVPILLGAPKLDRRGMRDAVNAGIEGVFRQPIDPARLSKIIDMVLKKPRRFVLEENYFGPARPQDIARMAKQSSGAPTRSTKTNLDPPRTQTKPEKTIHMEADLVSMASTTTDDTSPQAKSTRRRTPDTANSAASLYRSDAKPSLNGAGKTFDDDELTGVPAARDKKTRAQNIEAVQSARTLLDDTPVATPKKAAQPPTDEIDTEDDPATTEEELVEIDLQDALVSHKLWVDTGGKEGTVMSIEHADLREAELEGIDLSRCGLPFASFQRANCKNAVLRRCNLIAADFVESNLDNANLAASRLSGARFNKAMVRNTVFLGSDLSNANFRGLRMVNCDLSGTNLAGTDFRDADLSGTRGLFAEQIQRARVNANTRLPQSLKLRG